MIFLTSKVLLQNELCDSFKYRYYTWIIVFCEIMTLSTNTFNNLVIFFIFNSFVHYDRKTECNFGCFLLLKMKNYWTNMLLSQLINKSNLKMIINLKLFLLFARKINLKWKISNGKYKKKMVKIQRLKSRVKKLFQVLNLISLPLFFMGGF